MEIILRDGKVFDPFRFTLTVLSYLKNEYPEFAFIDNGRGGYFIDNRLGPDALRQEGLDHAALTETEKEKIDAFAARMKTCRIL
ncbi:MAG: hypothetical protein MJZ70_05125, partial [Bacteroidales bacterium]|nr:hypothetical protein [Bacteroidales bacterium]